MAVLLAGILVGASGQHLLTVRWPGQGIVCALVGTVGAFLGALIGHHLGFFRDVSEASAYLAPLGGAMVLMLSFGALQPAAEA